MRTLLHGEHVETLQLSAALALVCLAFTCLTWIDARDVAAHTREVRGLTRGGILARNGTPLAWTVAVQGVPQRRYALASAAPVLGSMTGQGGWSGLEGYFNRDLTAQPVGGLSGAIMHLAGVSAEGDRVRLTLDPTLQRAAARALAGRPGAVVVLKPETGDVLAMATGSSCGGRRRQSQMQCEAGQTNAAMSPAIAPGSTFKIVTLSAALDTGIFHLSDLFSGADAFGPSPYFDNQEYPSNVTRTDLTAITLEQALAFSDNFTFAHVGLTIGAHRLLTYAHRFGIGKTFRFPLPLAPSTIARGASHLSNSQLAQASFGGPVDAVTPVQMAMIASAVANRGVLMRPRLVSDIESRSGTVLRRFPPYSMGRVMSPRAAAEVTRAMVFVVDDGSGEISRISGVKVAGKTGTAASFTPRTNAWFIAFAPAVHPVVAVAVLRSDAGEGFKYAGPIAHSVLLAALRESRIVHR